MKRLLPCLFAALLLCACTPQPEESTSTFLAMDTVMTITAYGGSQDAVDRAADRVRELEALLSVTDPSSELYAANHSGGAPVEVSGDTAEVLSFALDLCANTGGALDVTIYPVVRAWGFTTGEYRVPAPEERSALLEQVDYTRISLSEGVLTVPDGMQLDLGAVGKGWAGDQIAALLAQDGVASAKLELGGNIQLLGSKPDGSPWRIAVRDPFGDGYAGVLEAADQAVVTSGGYERYFEEDGQLYWHILDPATGAPAHSGVVSATIAAPSGALADALSTALFVMGAEKAADYWRDTGGFDFILIGEDGKVTITEGLEERFSLSDGWSGHEVEIVRA